MSAKAEHYDVIVKPIIIRHVRRLDGKARPTGKVKPWLIPRAKPRPKK